METTKTASPPVIELPILVTLTAEGVGWLRRNKQKPRRVRTADDRLEYGIALRNFSAAWLEKMMNVDYVAAVEIARTAYHEKRLEIIELTRLVVNSILYRSFEQQTDALLLDSSLIRRWNRAHPSRTIDHSSIVNQVQVEGLLASCAAELPAVSEDIQGTVIREIEAAPELSLEEKEAYRQLCQRFVDSMHGITSCVLARSRSRKEYPAIIQRVCALLRECLSRAKIAEYLGLMVTELLTYTDSLRSLQVARKLSPQSEPGPQLLRDPGLRKAVAAHMRKLDDYLYLTYRVGSKAPSIGTDNRLRIVLFDRAEQYRNVKEHIEGKLGLDIREKSLVEFYRRIPEGDFGAELGLYYLSFLQAECSRRNVHLESHVSEVAGFDLTLINLLLQF